MSLPDSYPDFTAACTERTLQEESKGFFKTLVDTALNNTDIEKWNLKQSDQNVTSVDFVSEFVKKDRMVGKLIEIFTVKPIYRKKNLEKSVNARQLAIKELETSNFKNALLLSNQSVILSPCDDTDSLTKAASPLILALWVRSECLMKMELFQLALADLQYAVKICDTAEKKGPFFYRQGECYKNLNEIKRAKISYNLALKCMKKNATFYKPAETELINLPENDSPTNNNIMNCDKDDELLNGSEYLEIKRNEEMGRFVVAKKNVSIGEKILVEEPYAACLKFSSYGTNCHHCFKRLQVSYGCQTCANVAFCSIQCRDAAVTTYHNYECSFMDLFIGSGMSILCFVALRMLTQNGLLKSLDLFNKYMNKTNEKVKILNDVSILNSEELIFNLCTHTEFRKPLDFLKRFLMAFFLLKCLKGTSFFGNDRNENELQDDEVKVLILLFNNIQMLQFNAHEIEEVLYNEGNKKNLIKTRAIGVGIYPTVSLFNHDCYQSVLRYFQGKNIVIQSSKPISVGEMIPENYGATFSRQTKIERQRLLRSRYWFKCQCTACIEIWPTIEELGSEKIPKLKCSSLSCGGKVDVPLTDCESFCDICQNVIGVDYLQEKVSEIKNCIIMYQEAENLMKSSKFNEAINVYKKALSQFHEIAYLPHQETHIAEHNLRMCIMSEDYHKNICH